MNVVCVRVPCVVDQLLQGRLGGAVSLPQESGQLRIDLELGMFAHCGIPSTTIQASAGARLQATGSPHHRDRFGGRLGRDDQVLDDGLHEGFAVDAGPLEEGVEFVAEGQQSRRCRACSKLIVWPQ